MNKGLKITYLTLLISCFITVFVATAIYLGALPATVVATTGVLSIFGWSFQSSQKTKFPKGVFTAYLLLILILQVQNIEEWIFHYAPLYSGVNFIDYIQFSIFSIGVSAFLILGAVAFFYKQEIGRYMAWFAFSWALVRGISLYVQPLIESGGLAYIGGQATALLTICCSVIGIRKLLVVKEEENFVVKEPKVNNISSVVYVTIVALFIAIYAFNFYGQAGLAPTIIVCGSMFGGMIFWMFTTLKHRMDPRKLLPIYLLTLSLFYFHILEECITDFPGSINSIFNTAWTMNDFMVLIVFIGPIIWTFGAIALYYRNPLGYFLTWFVFFGMLIGEPTHYLVFPNIQAKITGSYGYFSAMWTALFAMIPAVYGCYITLKEYKKGDMQNLDNR